MTKIDLRRGDFEAMHPTAKLFNFDAEKMIYFGDRSESINHQWTTWCACIGMLHLEVKEAQVVPEVLKKFCNEHKDPAWRGRLTEYDKGYSDCCIAVLEMIELQEPAND